MNGPCDPPTPYGIYAPGTNTWCLRLITRLGLAHGKGAKLLLKRWLKSHGPLVDAEVRGVKYRLDLAHNATDTKILISSKVYDGPELTALGAASRGRVFVDIGANTGYYSLNMLAAACERVIAIEPNPPALQRLRYNIAINRQEPRITVIPEAVGPQGEMDLYQPPGLGSASLVPPGGGQPSIKVRTRPLLAMLLAEGIAAVGGMKIDVEGFEDRVLGPFFQDAPAALLPDCLVMEVCHADKWQHDLRQTVAGHGYQLVRQTRSNLIYQRRS